MSAPAQVPRAVGENRLPARRSRDSQVTGALLIVFGAGWIARQAGIVAVSWAAILSVVLVTLGVGMVVTSRSAGRSRGLIVIGAVITVLAASTSSLEGHPYFRGGDFHEAPPSVAAIEPSYRLAFGQLTIDLTDVDDFEAGQTVPIAARVTFGQLVVVVPDDVSFRVSGRVGAGDVEWNGRSLGEGIGVNRVFTSDGYHEEGARRLDLSIRVLFGSAEVRGGR